MRAKDTIKVSANYRHVTISSSISERYARKLIQEHLKSKTNLYGWYCFIDRDNEDSSVYRFELYNPLRVLAMGTYL